jgi:hypothetical protein
MCVSSFLLIPIPPAIQIERKGRERREGEDRAARFYTNVSAGVCVWDVIYWVVRV